MSAEKTAPLTSARLATRPTTDPAVCLQALIAGHISSAVYLTKPGLHMKSQASYPGKLSGI